MPSELKIVVINGSAKRAEKSLNLRVAKVVQKVLEEAGVEATLVHLGDEELPLFRGYDEPYPERVKEFYRLFEKADGYVVVTPEYHHIIPATLKNIFEYEKGGPKNIFADKPVALMSASPGQFGGLQAQRSLYGLFRTLRMWLVPEELAIPRADKVFLEDGTVADEAIKERLEALLSRFLKATEFLRKLRISP